jgi:hypothetical protein
VGLNIAARSAFDAAEIACGEQRCLCPPSPTTAEDGKIEDLPAHPIAVDCLSALCFARVR